MAVTFPQLGWWSFISPPKMELLLISLEIVSKMLAGGLEEGGICKDQSLIGLLQLMNALIPL